MTTTPTIWLGRSSPNYTLSGPGGNDQTHGRGIGLSNGNFLIVWETNVNEDLDGTSRTEIWGEIFDPLGGSISGEIRLAGTLTGSFRDFTDPEIVADDSGGFYLAYEQNPNGLSSTWYVGHYNSSGVELGRDDTADTIATYWWDQTAKPIGLPEISSEGYFLDDPVLAPDTGGTYVVAQSYYAHVNYIDQPDYGPYETLALGGDGYSFYSWVDSILLDFPSDLANPSIDSLKSGYGAVTAHEFVDFGAGRTDTIIRVTSRADLDYNLPQLVLLSCDQPEVAALERFQDTTSGVVTDANFVVVYRTNGNIKGGVYNAFTGLVRAFDVDLGAGEQSKPHVAELADGGFVVAWIDEYATDQREVRLQRFDGDGFKVGSEITFANPDARYIWDIDLETMANGRVLITVSDGTGNRGIAYAIYNVDDGLITGTDAGETLTANTTGSAMEGLGGNDTLIGLGGDDWMSGGTGTDSFDGGGGNDTVDYTYSNSNWVINLVTDTAVAGSTTESILRIENANGGGGNDVITGDHRINILQGNGGDDVIIGGLGADDIDGGSGVDWVDYRSEWTSGLGTRTYDLEAGEMRWEPISGFGGYTERLVNVENIKGSSFNDTFIANFLPNEFFGYNGNDSFIAANIGSVTIGFLADTYNGGGGTDTADFSKIVVADGDTSASRSFTFVLSPIGPAAPAGTVTEDGGGLIAELFGIETLRGTAYDDSMTGNDGNNQLNGGKGNDTLIGKAGDDDLRGGDGDDILKGNGGTDIFNGGNGSDTVDYSGNTFSSVYDLALQTFTGAGSETWVSIENVIAGSGNDRLIGGAGVNILEGGAGDDTYEVNDAGDVVIEAAGGGVVDYVLASVSYVLTAGSEVEFLAADTDDFTAAINLTGNEFTQTIIGNDGQNVLNDGGGSGSDRLIGLAGNDTYRVSSGRTEIGEGVGLGRDTVRTTVNFELNAGAEVERLFVLSPTSTKALDITGNEFDQEIRGNEGVNRLKGGGGADELFGLGGDDTLDGGDDADILDGGDGIDTVDYSESDAAVWFNFSNGVAIGGDGEGDVISNVENMIGSDFNDIFTGNAEDNALDGGKGADRLNGGNGQDELTGGEGNDTFVYFDTAHSAAGAALRDTITDFKAGGDADRIDVSSIDARASSAGSDEAFVFIGMATTFSAEGQIRVTQSGSDALLHFNTSGSGGAEMQILLLGVDAASLTAADFIL